jgi:hypothetical protein
MLERDQDESSGLPMLERDQDESSGLPMLERDQDESSRLPMHPPIDFSYNRRLPYGLAYSLPNRLRFSAISLTHCYPYAIGVLTCRLSCVMRIRDFSNDNTALAIA